MTGWTWLQRGLLLGAWLVTLSQARAVERTLRIEAPAMVAAGQPLSIVISASTDAGKGEQVGFLQVEVSMDEGKTWTAICYLQKSGPRVVQRTSLTAGPAGTTVMLRSRAAFRDGVAGDVDYSGAAIHWEGSWTEWTAPPAKRARIVVKAP